MKQISILLSLLSILSSSIFSMDQGVRQQNIKQRIQQQYQLPTYAQTKQACPKTCGCIEATTSCGVSILACLGFYVFLTTDFEKLECPTGCKRHCIYDQEQHATIEYSCGCRERQRDCHARMYQQTGFKVFQNK